MANRFNNPFPQFFDSTPNVYSAGVLRFYLSGTSTPLAVYSNEDLSPGSSLGTSITLNAAGRPATDVFLQDYDYKVTLEDEDGNPIWTADPVKGRDSQLVVKTVTGSGSPNGSVAGTAGSAGVLPDFYWDYTNSVLYVCTITGSSSTAVWTAINAASTTTSVPFPQGRLTLTSGTPVLAASVTSATSLYYTPYTGNLVPIYNGASMAPTEFSELTLSLVSSHASNTIYDVFVFSNSGVLTLVTGPAWTTSTAGSGARGSGASTTELTRVKGLLVNAVQMTARNGSTTYTVGANLATYVGTIWMDGSAGQLTCHVLWGQSRKWGVWNAYNRKPIVMMSGDSTGSWAYSTGTFRNSNNTAANGFYALCGLAEEYIECDFSQNTTTGSSSAQTAISIGKNSSAVGYAAISTTGANGFANPLKASHVEAPFLGINLFTSMEYSAVASTTFNGGNDDMVLRGSWMG
jgi:hypothetical protein